MDGRPIVIVVLGLCACRPDLGPPGSLVSGPAILAVRGSPPEAPPASPVSYDLLVATADGSLVAPGASWANCLTARAPSEPGPVAAACLTDGVAVIGGPAPSVQAAIPASACEFFGSEVPPQTAGEPPARPRDPDVTGGYYQPVRVQVPTAGGSLEAFGFERIVCNLASAPIDVALEFRARYVPNTAPVLASLSATVDRGEPVELAGVVGGVVPPDALHVPRGSTVGLEVAWPVGSAETFIVYDLVSRSLTTMREAMRVSWYTSAGELAHDHTGRDASDGESSTSNEISLPTAPGAVHVWVVLRDSRGGVAWREAVLVVE